MKKKLKITFLSPPTTMSGGIRVIAIYAKALQDMGHSVTWVTPPRASPGLKQRLKFFLQGKSFQKKVAPPSHAANVGLDVKVINARRPIVDSDVPDGDIVIATWWETAEWVYALSPKKGRKVYFVQHHEVFDNLPYERCRATYRLPLQKITIAQWLVDTMRDDYGDTHVELVPNSVDHSQFFAPARTKQQLPTVGFLYNVAHFKGLDITLAAIALVKQQIPNLRVICFGSRPPSPDFPLPDYCEMTVAPPQDQIRDKYAACDVWVTCSRTEGFNLPAMEAMACRTPVVSTKAGWPDESVKDGYNGFLLEVDDVNGVAAAMVKVLQTSPAGWEQLSNQAYATVRHSSWEKSSKMFEDCLYRAIENTQPPAAKVHA